MSNFARAKQPPRIGRTRNPGLQERGASAWSRPSDNVPLDLAGKWKGPTDRVAPHFTLRGCVAKWQSNVFPKPSQSLHQYHPRVNYTRSAPARKEAVQELPGYGVNKRAARGWFGHQASAVGLTPERQLTSRIDSPASLIG